MCRAGATTSEVGADVREPWPARFANRRGVLGAVKGSHAARAGCAALDRPCALARIGLYAVQATDWAAPCALRLIVMMAVELGANQRERRFSLGVSERQLAGSLPEARAC